MLHKNTKPHRIENNVEEKQCHKCMVWKSLANYNKASTWDKLDRKCKDCCKEYRNQNKDRLNAKKKEYRDLHKDDRKAWLNANKDAQKEYNKKYQEEYRQKNLDKLKNYAKDHFQKNKKRINERQKEKRATDPTFRIACNLRSRLSIALNGRAKSNKTEKLIGCTYEQLKNYLENQFDNKMTWENYGEWHVDHIIPCAFFNLADPIEQEICFHYINLRPMWGPENIAKNDSLKDVDIHKLPPNINDEVLVRLIFALI